MPNKQKLLQNQRMLNKDGRTSAISEAADQMTIKALSEPVERHFICFPRELRNLL